MSSSATPGNRPGRAAPANSGAASASGSGSGGGSASDTGVRQAFSLLGAFVALSMVAGLLGAGIFVPVVGLGGLATKEAVGTFDALPAEFTASPMAQQSQILASDGSVIATLYEENRTVVPLEKISKVMQDAQIAIEDDRFYQHGGIDTRGIARAVFQTAQGNTQGASTITQQFVKQTRIYSALKDDNEDAAAAAQARGGIPGVVRKLQEAKYALALEEKLSKKQILEGYLNLVYYGAGAYGVEAAANRYFGVSAEKLTLPQAALIAGMAQRPGATDPFQYPERALERRNAVLERMRDTKHISTQRMREAQRVPITLNPTKREASCPASKDPYFCDFVKAWLMEQPSLGDTPAEREKRVYRGGLKIKTTYDVKLNAAVKKSLEARLPVGNRQHRGTAAAVVEPGTGHVIALAQNTTYTSAASKKFGQTSVNWTVDHRYGGSGGFQIGSTAKMFGVVTALEEGMSANSSVNAPPDGTRYSATRLGGNNCGYRGTSFAPFNAESNEHGRMTLQHATALSVNTAFVQLASMVGVCKERATMKKMGLRTATNGEYGESGMAAVILGADNASPLTVASAYATLAAGGKYCEPVPVTDITAFDGKKFAVSDGKCTQVVNPQIAYRTTRILQTVLSEGTGKAIGLPDGRQAAGKTGTSDNSKQTWFAGYTPQRAAAVWVGTPDRPRPMRGVYGATIAGPLWSRIMAQTSQGLPRQRFSVVETSAKDAVQVPDVVGLSRNQATRRLEQAGFDVSVSDQTITSNRAQRGQVAASSPEGGDRALRGETVTLTLSGGLSSGSASPTGTATAVNNNGN